jgi:hypothetical protein
MTNITKLNIPSLKNLQGEKIKILEALTPNTSVEAGEYSADNMRKWSGSISYYKRLKGNSKKVFAQRQALNSEGKLIINLYRIK